MNSSVSISAPSGAGKTQFAEALGHLVKLFYGEAATVATGVQYYATDTLSFDLDMDKLPGYQQQRAVVQQLKGLRFGGIDKLTVTVNGEQVADAIADKLREFGFQPGGASSQDEDKGSLDDCVRRYGNRDTLPFGGFPASTLVTSRHRLEADTILFDLKRGILRVGGVTMSLQLDEPARREFNGTKNMGHSH